MHHERITSLAIQYSLVVSKKNQTLVSLLRLTSVPTYLYLGRDCLRFDEATNNTIQKGAILSIPKVMNNIIEGIGRVLEWIPDRILSNSIFAMINAMRELVDGNYRQ